MTTLHCSIPSQSATSCLSPLLPQISASDQTDSKYIGFHEGGFLQVAVSEAPSLTAIVRPLLRGGAPDIALGLVVTYRLELYQQQAVAIPQKRGGCEARRAFGPKHPL